MMSSEPRSRAILAAAGSRKTELIIDTALSVSGRVLITTFTDENRRQLARRIQEKVGFIPANIDLMGWFSFLIRHGARPFQTALTKQPFKIAGLNFMGRRSRYARKTNLRYFLDQDGNLFRDEVSAFVDTLNTLTRGAVIDRLESIYSHILVDEVQDLAGYDLDVLASLFCSRIQMLLVGDPRQTTLRTNLGSRNKKYQGVGLADWLRERTALCVTEERTESFRCNQAICDFADSIFPTMARTTSIDVPATQHDGIFAVRRDELSDYLDQHTGVKLLKDRKTQETFGLAAMNIGVAKGSTFDRVVIFPTNPMLRFLWDRRAEALKAPQRLYVAVTRARFSVAFVLP